MKHSLIRGVIAPTLVVVATLGLSQASQAQTLGAAAPYNGFFFEDHTARNVDLHGKIAVGRDANYTNYTIATREQTNTVNTVVGRNYTNSIGQVTGSIVAGGNITHTTPSINGNVSARGNVTLTNGGTVNGAIQYGGSFTGPGYDINGGNPTTQVNPNSIVLPVDFAAAQTDLTARADYWKTLTPTLTQAAGNNSIVFNNLAAGLNVLNLTTTQIQNANTFQFNGNSNATLLVNVIGTGSVTVPNVFPGTGLFDRVLFNFADVTSIVLNGSFDGSLLAPRANITVANPDAGGAFNGQLIARSGNTGRLELHTDFNGRSAVFTGSLPSAPAVPNDIPEPGTLALLGSVVLGGLVVRRRK